MSDLNFVVINLQNFGTTSQNIKEELGSSAAEQEAPNTFIMLEQFNEKVIIFNEEITLSKRV